MKFLLAAALVGIAQASNATTTPTVTTTPFADCTILAGYANTGPVSSTCCSAHRVVLSYAVLNDPVYAAYKALISTCYVDTVFGGSAQCMGTTHTSCTAGTEPECNFPSDTANYLAIKHMCETETTCSSGIAAAYNETTKASWGNKTKGALNPTLQAGWNHTSTCYGTWPALQAAAAAAAAAGAPTTTIAPEVKVKVKVDLKMNLPSNATSASLMASTNFKAALKQGFAEALGTTYTASQITIDAITIASRRALLGNKRRLAEQTVKVDWSVTVADATAAQTVVNTASDKTAFNAAVKTKVNKAIAADTTLASSYTVTEATVGTVSAVDANGGALAITAATASPTVLADGASSAPVTAMLSTGAVLAAAAVF